MTLLIKIGQRESESKSLQLRGQFYKEFYECKWRNDVILLAEEAGKGIHFKYNIIDIILINVI